MGRHRTQALLSSAWVLLCISWSTLVRSQSVTPFEMTWSNKSHGADGPWNAVQVGIGSPSEQQVAMYPGAVWESKVILQSVCSNSSVSSACYASAAGTFDPTQSSSWNNETIELPPAGDWQVYQLGFAAAVPVYALAHRAIDTIDIGGILVPESDLGGIEQGYSIYPGGQNYPLEVGLLSLGSPNINQSFSQTNNYSVNGTFITSYTYEKNNIPSYSYGLHIGSAALNIPGSLFLGGYDQSRVLGNVSSQAYNGGSFPIQLVDIGIGVVTGGSPWTYQNKSGLLAAHNSSMPSSINVLASTVDPYIYLPQSACNSLAAELPVTYNSNLGLYIWNTSDPKYSRIIQSPSYLAFTFWQNGVNDQNLTINVPFALLNLTLNAPLVTQPTQYFPCMPTTGPYVLGQAFFQAAFIGVNWGGKGLGNWFLAQAPGPGYSTAPTQTIIEPDATTVISSNSSWEQSWSQYWTALPEPSSTSATTSTTPGPTQSATEGNNSNGGLSTGAKAGIGVGCAVAGIVIVALVAWLVMRRRLGKQQDPSPQSTIGPKTDGTKSQFNYYGGPTAPINNVHASENNAPEPLYELPNTHPHTGPHELS